jgi:hypothetical protein
VEFAAILGAIAAAAGTIGTGAWKIIDRADKSRERREIKVEELLKSRVAELLSSAKTEARYADKVHAFATKWREQLVAHGITPEPAEWPTREDNNE